MENKINIAKLLKDCPSGMELDCILYDNIYFDIVEHDSIKCYIQNKGYRTSVTFDVYGGLIDSIPTKCVIFPKGKTTWEGFQRPFKDGDILISGLAYNPFIFKQTNGLGNAQCYCAINIFEELVLNSDNWTPIKGCRLATEEEKQKLFQAIKDNGYKWDTKTKTLEKLIEPVFKVGNRITKRDSIENSWVVSSVSSEYYGLQLPKGSEGIGTLPIIDQDKYELIPNKFDITTLKPFDKVLVRDKSNEVWTANFYSHYDATSDKPFICVGWSEMNEYRYCIPYEGNEHLLGTTNDCDEFYKTWD